MPQLIQTDDFVRFRIGTLNGPAAQNKGMALFPRRIGGQLRDAVAPDRENLHLATRDDVRLWNESPSSTAPADSWELLQIGNCGSPIETRGRLARRSPTASGRCGATRSAPCCSTSTIRGR